MASTSTEVIYRIGVIPADLSSIQQQVANAATAGLAQALHGGSPGGGPSFSPPQGTLFSQLQQIRNVASGGAPAGNPTSSVPSQSPPTSMSMNRLTAAINQLTLVMQGSGRYARAGGRGGYPLPQGVAHSTPPDAHLVAFDRWQRSQMPSYGKPADAHVDAFRKAKAAASKITGLSDLFLAQAARRNKEADRELKAQQNAPNFLSHLFGYGGSISPIGRVLGLRHHGWLTGVLRGASKGQGFLGKLAGGAGNSASASISGASGAAGGAGGAAGASSAAAGAGGLSAMLGSEGAAGAAGGPIGLAVAGVAVALTVAVAAVYGFASAMDSITEKFGKYSAGASAADAGYQVQQMQSNLAFAQAFEPFMVSWLEFKTKVLGLITTIAVPVIDWIGKHPDISMVAGLAALRVISPAAGQVATAAYAGYKIFKLFGESDADRDKRLAQWNKDLLTGVVGKDQGHFRARNSVWMEGGVAEGFGNGRGGGFAGVPGGSGKFGAAIYRNLQHAAHSAAGIARNAKRIIAAAGNLKETAQEWVPDQKYLGIKLPSFNYETSQYSESRDPMPGGGGGFFNLLMTNAMAPIVSNIISGNQGSKDGGGGFGALITNSLAQVSAAIAKQLKVEQDFSEYTTYMKSINTEVKVQQDFQIQLQNENQVHGAVERLKSFIESGMQRVADETSLRLGFLNLSLAATANV